MRRDLQTAVVPFPKGLMSTARSALAMPATFGREVRNMLMAADGAGAKRNGVVAVGSAIAGETVVAVMGFQAAAGYQLMVATNAGKIYRQNGAAWELVYSGLDGAGVVRTVAFAGRLLLCNGVDDVLVYDGSAWSVVSRLVVDSASGLTFVSSSQFRINSTASFYAVGSQVRAKLGTTFVTANVSAVSVSGPQVTVTLNAAVLTSALNEVAYTVKPPKFAFMAAAHDRLWGFGKGPLVASLSSDVERMRVFYTHGVNDHAAWPDPATGVIPSINLADKAGVADELLAMAVKDGMTVFVGRNHLQLWVGSNPNTVGDFGWSKTIPLGAVHGSAVMSLPNDLMLLTRQGVRTLSRSLQTEQLDVSDVGGELDPTVNALLGQVLADVAAYRRVVPLRFEPQGWLGVALGDVALVWQIGAFGQGWVVFDGVFGGATASHNAPDGTLYVAKGGQVYRYDTAAWSDAGEAIVTRWWTPWLRPAADGKRWANKYVELLVAPAVSMPVTLRRYDDYDDANPQVLTLEVPPQADFWDSAEWDSAAWDSGGASNPVARDHVVVDVLAMALESASVNGPLTVFGLKLYGVAER
ncbi:MAG: hypothetical protein EBR79_01310 [Proteobacteria bacterium]|nr:hypothetical protein [Pseudomonadota bacterium]